METWIDTTGDDFWRIHDEGTKVPSPPIGFSGHRYLYVHDGRLVEITPCWWYGDSCWQITVRGPAPELEGASYD